MIAHVDPNDAAFVLEWWTGPTQGPVDFHNSPILYVDGTSVPLPAGTFAGYVPGPLADSWPALGEFGPTASSP